MASIRGFLSTFENLKNQQKVSQSALTLPTYCNSVISKLRVAENHLHNLLSIRKWALTTGSSNATATSGDTIAPTFPVISPDTKVTGELDDFFIDLKSSFEIFGQVINLVYLDQPLDEDDVSFFGIVKIMKIKKPNAPNTVFLDSTLTAKWFVDLGDFRERAYHRRNILWETYMKCSNVQATDYPQVLEISIQDSPDSPTFRENKTVRNFCLPLLESSKNAIDKSFKIMNTDGKNANKIPV